jgi:NADH-quinone oxidoreductase subunit H
LETIYQQLRIWFVNAPDSVLLWTSMAIPILFVLSVFLGIFAYTTLVERKALGRIQNRFGPNRVGMG